MPGRCAGASGSFDGQSASDGPQRIGKAERDENMRRDIVFVDIDTQHDFLDEDGALAVPGAGEIRANLRRLTAAARRLGIPIIASEDAHAPDDPEFAQFGRHCVRGSPGARKVEETTVAGAARFGVDDPAPKDPAGELAKGQVILEKCTLEPFTSPASDVILGALPDAAAAVYGVATDYCVRRAAEGLLRRGRRVILVRDAIRGISEEASRKAISDLEAAGAVLVDADALIEAATEGRVERLFG